jgi:hypothetical protein
MRRIGRFVSGAAILTLPRIDTLRNSCPLKFF